MIFSLWQTSRTHATFHDAIYNHKTAGVHYCTCLYHVWNVVIYHATDGPPKIGPPGPSTANFVAIVGPPRLTMAAMDSPPDYLRRHRLSPPATDGPP